MLGEDVVNRRAIASICYINQRNRRKIQPRFLKRNLRDILNSHERQLRASTADVPHDRQDMVANHQRPWGWDFPTTDMLRDYMNGRRPVLQVERLQLRRPQSKTTIRKSTRERHSNPSWLQDGLYRQSWECVVNIAISTPRDNTTTKKQIHYESLSATIETCQSSTSGDQWFDIVLEKPFFFKVDKLFVVTESSTNGIRSWKRTVNAPYTLDISIQCQDSYDSREFLTTLEGLNVAEMPANEAVLKATWDKLPTCPADGQALDVRRAKGHKSLEIYNKLEIAMGWINRKDYALKTYNKLYEQQQTPARQLPTPSASSDADRPPKAHQILWNFHDGTVMRSMPVKALTCALCQNNYHYACFSYLVLHCKRDHDHFNFDVQDVSNNETAATFHATIAMRAAPPQAEKLDTVEDPEMNWVAPDRPFDLKAYLRGEDTWTGQIRPKSRKGMSRPNRERDTQNGPVALPSRKRPALEDVDDLPQHTAKKNRVPIVPNVTFYRTTSKQSIKQGTWITESDDEIDQSWLAQNQSQALDDLGVIGVTKLFTQAFNQHLAREQSDSSILTREAMVRFTRRHRDRLENPQWQRLFRAKLEQLRSVGIIGQDVITHCERLIDDARSREDHDSEEMSTTELNGGKTSKHFNATGPTDEKFLPAHSRDHSIGKPGAQSNSNGTHLPSPLQTPPTRKRCICGEVPTDRRKMVACADHRCKRQDYHLACVGLERRIPGWRCEDCVGRSM